MIDGTLDAGITYTEGVSGDMFRIDPLYGESYVLLAPASLVAPGATQISWKDAAALPLTLLEPGMQNRRILSRIFEDVGAQPLVVAETNGLIAALVMAVEGAAATVVPKALVDSLGPIRGTVALPLVDPQVEKAISFVTSLRPRRLPTVEAMRKMLLAK
jgi:DNA-binding transcriptional LysR family regulator